MLPSGHVAAGFLTAEAVLKIFHPDLPAEQYTQLLWWGMLFGFAPDVDVFWFFIKNKTLLVANREAVEKPHRKFPTHVPLYWLIAGLTIYFFSDSVYCKYVGLLVWFGSWSHFILDSIEYGIPWLSPFSNKFFALKDVEKIVVPERNFFKHSIQFLRIYSTRPTFYLEVVVIISALIIYFR